METINKTPKNRARVVAIICIVALITLFICAGYAIGKTKAGNSIPSPKATGKLLEKNSTARIDYSNTKDGYICVRRVGKSSKKLKVMVQGPRTTYTYDLPSKKTTWQIFSLTDGSGTYTIGVYKNVSGTKYATALSKSVKVKIKNEFAPFLIPNQFVDYRNAKKTVAKGKSLTAKSKNTLDKVGKVYNFTVKNIKYDKTKAKNVKSGYVPNLDNVLKKKKGICFDYAALMTGMLRSQGIPCKLVVGYAGSVYHAWISVYTKEHGWIDKAIYFDGKKWKRMDPTFASSSKSSKDIMKYIGDGTNYKMKYMY